MCLFEIFSLFLIIFLPSCMLDDLFCDDEFSIDDEFEQYFTAGTQPGSMSVSSEEESKEEQLPNECSQLPVNVPSVQHVQAASVGQSYFESAIISEGCYCLSGETCRWRAPPPYRRIPAEKIIHSRCEFLRLRYFESWKLPDDEVDQGEYQLCLQGRSGTHHLWRNSGNLLNIESVEVGHCCRNDQLWIIPVRGCGQVAWLLSVKSSQDSGVQVLLYELIYYEIIGATCSSNSIYWNGKSHSVYRRLVEWKFALRETFQGTSAIHIWSTQRWKDYAPSEVKCVFENIRDASTGGFLRLV